MPGHLPPPAPASMPAASLIAQLARELAQHPPFAQMQMRHVESFAARCQQRYFASGETMLSPQDGPVRELLVVRRGAITRTRDGTQMEPGSGNFLYEAGDLLPVGAAMAGRAVTAHYQASEDCFALALPLDHLHILAAQSPPLADFLSRHIQHVLALSRKALQAHYASRVLAEQSMETPLAELTRRKPVTCTPDTPLATALRSMHQHSVGSILVTDASQAPLGILTRHDILDKITLPAVPLETPIAQLMSTPVHTLDMHDTAHDAALLMSRQGIRHVPVTQSGALVGIVSERDLFAMQRLSLPQLSQALRKAPDLPALRHLAPDIRHFAERLLGQGVQARQLTHLVSHLNDLLTQRLLDLLAVQHRLPSSQACWLALGSEGREEQTVATDQDNALVLPDGMDIPTRARWISLAREANDHLKGCGYPLCQGNIMAGNAELALHTSHWQTRFTHWMTCGTPQDLLNASIFFDLRPLWGNHTLAAPLREFITQQATQTPRFLHLLALNALQRNVPMTWTGAIDAHDDGTVDIKLRGTAIFVDIARLYALAHGVPASNTRARLLAVGPHLGAPAREYEGWVAGFEFLQMLRLRVQMDIAHGIGNPDQPNCINVSKLNAMDRRILKESLRLLDLLQKRLRLDYAR
jgi:CBS domain-containing protein